MSETTDALMIDLMHLKIKIDKSRELGRSPLTTRRGMDFHENYADCRQYIDRIGSKINKLEKEINFLNDRVDVPKQNKNIKIIRQFKKRL